MGNGLTYEQVAEAAEALEATGERASVRKVVKLVGFGSYSTAAPLLRQRNEQKKAAENVAQERTKLPESVKVLFDNAALVAWQKLQETSQDELTALSERLHSQIKDITDERDELLKDLEAADEEIRSVKTRVVELDQALAAAENASANKDKAIDELGSNLAAANFRVEIAEAEAAAMKQQTMGFERTIEREFAKWAKRDRRGPLSDNENSSAS